MGCGGRLAVVTNSRRVLAGGVPEPCRAPGLVERDPRADRVAECLGNDPRVLREPPDRIARYPPARVLEGLRQVPVIEGDHRYDRSTQQPVNQAAVEIEAGFIGRTSAGRLDARPSDGEAVSAGAQPREQVEVVVQTPIVIARDVAGVAVARRTGPMAEGVPDGRAATVGIYRAFDLIRRGLRPPEEAVRERAGSALQCHDWCILPVAAADHRYCAELRRPFEIPSIAAETYDPSQGVLRRSSGNPARAFIGGRPDARSRSPLQDRDD